MEMLECARSSWTSFEWTVREGYVFQEAIFLADDDRWTLL